MSFFSNVYRRLSALDLDEIFSYNTTKEVRMLDRRLGMVCWVIRIIVLAYVVGYVFLVKEQYTEEEKSVGHAISSVNGTTYSRTNGVVRPWDVVDAVQPALENGAAFVSTMISVTAGQTIANFSNPQLPCTSHADCVKDLPLSYGQCVANQCEQYGWQPPYSDTDRTSTAVYELEGADTFGVWLRASIQFPTLDAARIFTTMDVTSPTAYAGGSAPGASVSDSTSTSTTIGDGKSPAPDYFTVGELLSLAGTSYATIRDTGCTLAVTFLWDCFVDASDLCHPKLQVSRVDLNERRRGFGYQYATYYAPVPAAAGGAETRDLYTVKGVRLLVSSIGKGRQISISEVILQISSGIALLWLAGFASDVLMLYVLPEKKHYRTYKQERTPDFSDLRNKIAEVEGEKKKLRDRKNRFAAKLDES